MGILEGVVLLGVELRVELIEIQRWCLCCQGGYFYYDSGLVFFCVHKSSRVVHQFSQGLEIGVSRGMRGAIRL